MLQKGGGSHPVERGQVSCGLAAERLQPRVPVFVTACIAAQQVNPGRRGHDMEGEGLQRGAATGSPMSCWYSIAEASSAHWYELHAPSRAASEIGRSF